jgi:hypothetical protein
MRVACCFPNQVNHSPAELDVSKEKINVVRDKIYWAFLSSMVIPRTNLNLGAARLNLDIGLSLTPKYETEHFQTVQTSLITYLRDMQTNELHVYADCICVRRRHSDSR